MKEQMNKLKELQKKQDSIYYKQRVEEIKRQEKERGRMIEDTLQIYEEVLVFIDNREYKGKEELERLKKLLKTYNRIINEGGMLSDQIEFLKTFKSETIKILNGDYYNEELEEERKKLKELKIVEKYADNEYGLNNFLSTIRWKIKNSEEVIGILERRKENE